MKKTTTPTGIIGLSGTKNMNSLTTRYYLPLHMPYIQTMHQSNELRRAGGKTRKLIFISIQ
eukprot:3687449-Amphidinium_carterae.2